MAGDRKLNYPVTPQGGLQTWAEKNQQNRVETNHWLAFCARSHLGTTGDKRQASEGVWGSVTHPQACRPRSVTTVCTRCRGDVPSAAELSSGRR